ncbi:Transposon TX1 uncharacterized 149 kDa protein, partial [Linum grandiflorum]
KPSEKRWVAKSNVVVPTLGVPFPDVDSHEVVDAEPVVPTVVLTSVDEIVVPEAVRPSSPLTVVVDVEVDTVVSTIVSPLLDKVMDGLALEDDVLISTPAQKDGVVSLNMGAQSRGYHMIDLYRNLKQVKLKLKDLNRSDFSDLQKRVREAEIAMVQAQGCSLANPSTCTLEIEQVAVRKWNDAKTAEEIFFKQKACLDWIAEGDSNTSFFFNTVKSRQQRNFISQLVTASGETLTSANQIADETVAFYSQLLGKRDDGVRLLPQAYYDNLIIHKLDSADRNDLSRPIMTEEVRNALFSMGRDKCPGPDGFTAGFFQASWETVGTLFTAAVQEFFLFGRVNT